MSNPEPLQVPVIGVCRTPYAARGEAPRQGRLRPEVEGRLEVFPDYAPALDQIERFSHLIVLFAFDRYPSAERSLTGRPPGAGITAGAFACCTPRRPSGLGLDVCRLLRREDRTLIVAGVDMLDGSPLVSIRPYLTSVHSFPEAAGGYPGLERERRRD
ncbi:MAG: tRNA (N6-threonylcarbamoyladenosine(37)-N6)-methyltransferase TrmO [Candidatus Coatesbacteria bacterium]|nr:tRNA (N6-threonylcarbamoyladenosine(37)-N6)-methyltransferase TrmO [Candidatus Coatesbacteria bacterium]